MDLYEENFKIQDMIDSDMRSEFGDLFGAELGGSPPSLDRFLPPGLDSHPLDEDEGVAGGWMDSSHIFNTSADLDSIGGLLVNPQTALPISMPTPGVSSPTPPEAPRSSSTPPPPPDPTKEPAPAESPKPRSRGKTGSSKESRAGEGASYPKPAFSYSCLIAMALKNSKTGSLPVNEIYDFMTENFPYFKTAPNGWKNSVRHNLSLNKCFEKIEKPVVGGGGGGVQRKGYLWAMNPAKVEKMDEELQKWSSRDPAAIRKSMANPERLELIEKGELRNETEDKVCKEPPAGNTDPCLPELDVQKDIWENLGDEKFEFLSDSPVPPMDEDSLQECLRPPSFVHASYVYKCTAATPTPGAEYLLASCTDQGTTCDA